MAFPWMCLPARWLVHRAGNSTWGEAAQHEPAGLANCHRFPEDGRCKESLKRVCVNAADCCFHEARGSALSRRGILSLVFTLCFQQRLPPVRHALAPHSNSRPPPPRTLRRCLANPPGSFTGSPQIRAQKSRADCSARPWSLQGVLDPDVISVRSLLHRGR